MLEVFLGRSKQAGNTARVDTKHTHRVSLAVIGQHCADILTYIFSGEGG